MVGEDLVTLRLWFAQSTLIKVSHINSCSVSICAKTHVDLKEDEDFQRLQVEGNITITEGNVPFQNSHVAGDPTNHGNYLQLKVSHIDTSIFLSSRQIHAMHT